MEEKEGGRKGGMGVCWRERVSSDTNLALFLLPIVLSLIVFRPSFGETVRPQCDACGIKLMKKNYHYQSNILSTAKLKLVMIEVGDKKKKKCSVIQFRFAGSGKLG